MHAKVFSIQIFQYFCQIPPRVCTLVLFITSVKTLHAFAMRMLIIYIVGVVIIERARVIGARRFSAMCFGTTKRVYNAS